MENYDLLYTRWEDDIIWDSENMDHIPGMVHNCKGKGTAKTKYEKLKKLCKPDTMLLEMLRFIIIDYVYSEMQLHIHFRAETPYS